MHRCLLSVHSGYLDVIVVVKCVLSFFLMSVVNYYSSRAIGLGMKISAILAKGSDSEAPIILLLLFVGHAVGMLIAFVLGRECGCSFFNSLSQLLLDDVTGNGPHEQFFRLPLLKQVPNLIIILSGILNLKFTKKKDLYEPIC